MEWSEESQDSTLQHLMATRDSLRQKVSFLEARDWWLPFSRRSTKDELARAQADLGTVEQRIVARQEEIRRERWQRERAQHAQWLRAIEREHDHERDPHRERGHRLDRGGYER